MIIMFIFIQCEIETRAQQTIISEDTTWTLGNSPYIITGNVLVEHGATLTIEPGVKVKFDGFYYMQIEGKLVAEGTENNMITFTSNKDSPAPKDWRSIKFMKNADYGSSFKYCKIEYAYTGIVLDDIIFYAAPNITNSIIQDNSWGGIEYYTSGDSTINSNKQITNNTIMNTAEGHSIDIHFYVNSANASLLVSNNLVKYNVGNAIACTSNEGSMILSNNIIIKNDCPGIVCHGDNVSIKYNLIAGNEGPGIVIAGAERDTYLIEHNTILNNSDSNDKYGGGINFEQHEYTTNI
ncbi:MAG: right-handed parallel beta-helix repeat-containing protein, partial [Methanomassiliicoccales archaeon]